MEGDGSISQRHAAAKLRSQCGSFEEMLVTIKLFIAIVHQSDFNQGMRLALSSRRQSQFMRTCFLEYPSTAIYTENIP
jgi:hypothetical protein